MVRTGLFVSLSLFLLSLLSCRSIERGTTRTSSVTICYHIFVHEQLDEEGFMAAEIQEGFSEPDQPPPGPEYVEVTIEELHEMGYLTGEEALEEARQHGIVDEHEIEMTDGTKRLYGSSLTFRPYPPPNGPDKQYTAVSYTRSQLAPVEVWLDLDFTIRNEQNQIIHHWNRELGPRWNAIYWSHWGHYDGGREHTYLLQSNHWWGEKTGPGEQSEVWGIY